MQLIDADTIEALRRLLVALLQFGSKFAGPLADRIGRKEREATTPLHPKLELGYVFHEHDWTGPAIPATFEADAMHALLVLRTDAIEGCAENSDELAMIAETIAAYEAKRWPGGKG